MKFRARKIRTFCLAVMAIYGGGVIVSYLHLSQGERAACYAAGGFWGRIVCPDSVDTQGFGFYFEKALGWPLVISRKIVVPKEAPTKVAS